jgi:glutamine synthetase
MEAEQVEARAAQAREQIRRLREEGVRMLAITMVDNAGVTRVKSFPLSRFDRAARYGIGLSPVFDVFLVNDHITSSTEVGGPVGDLRLIPDPAVVRTLSAQPGWAWAPTDQYTQEGELFGSCQRSFARRMAEQCRRAGLGLRMAFEVEWFMARRSGPDGGDMIPAHRGPAYSAIVLAEMSDFSRELVAALEEEAIEAEQLHPEYATGQMEISIPPKAPLMAADETVLLRQTIRGVAARHGLSASFAPVAIAGEVGNGGHVHFSLWEGERNLFAGGGGPHGMTEKAEAFVAGVLDQLPALAAIGCPSVASYLRLVPSHWAGCYTCWGRENREAAIRFVTGMIGTQETAANTEVKCFDLSANPYLVAGSLIAAGLSGVERNLRLPAEFTDDPATHPEEELEELGVRRLPQSVEEAVSHLEGSQVLRDAMGPVLFSAFVAVRKAEAEVFRGMSAEDVVAAHRWRY